MKIAVHHKWKDTDYKPVCAWPDDTYVQWGAKGVVMGKDPYTTAFFEAFPADKENAEGFIRGEGQTIEDAEKDAFSKFHRQSECNHLWGREHYTNGGQLCRHCRAFRSGILRPITRLGEWRAPVNWGDTWLYEQEEGRTLSRYARKLKLRAKLFGVTERQPHSPALGR